MDLVVLNVVMLALVALGAHLAPQGLAELVSHIMVVLVAVMVAVAAVLSQNIPLVMVVLGVAGQSESYGVMVEDSHQQTLDPHNTSR
jgi:hypothetical protein